MYDATDHEKLRALSAAYLEMIEGYKKFPAAKVQDKAAMKPDTAKGEMQARKMDTVRGATDAFPETVKGTVKGQEMSNKKSGLEKKFKSPSVAGSEGAAKAKMGMEKPTPKRPKSRMPKSDMPGTMKK